MGNSIGEISVKKNRIYFLCNPEQRSFFPDEIIPICNENDFKTEIKNRAAFQQNTFGVILLLELKWDIRYYTDFLGLELIQRIRVQLNFDVPILLTSHYPALTYKGLGWHGYKKNGYQYLQDPSVCFISLFSLKELDLIDLKTSFCAPLTDPLLFNDLRENLYRESGYLSTFFNDLRNEVVKHIDFPDSGKNIYTFLRERLNNIRGIIDQKALLNQLMDILEANFGDDKNYDQGYTDSVVLSIKALVEEQDRYLPVFTMPENITILYVKDPIHGEQTLKEMLLRQKIECIEIPDSDLAIKMLEQHTIHIIICDFRFYDEHMCFQREQGYHIVRKIINELPNIYFFIILTNYKVQVIPLFFNSLNNIAIVKRNEIKGRNGMAKLAQLILEKEIQIKNEKERLPDFKEALKLYLKHCEDGGRYAVEKEISDFALKVIKSIINKEETIPHLPKSKGLVDGKNPKQNFLNFRTKLKARRVALGLYQLSASKLGHDNDQKKRWAVICSIIQTGRKTYQPSVIEQTKFGFFISRHLFGFKTKQDYHWSRADQLKLTPNERNWLIKYGEAIELDKLADKK